MANNNQLNTPPNTGPTKRNRTSVRADFEVTPEEHIEWMTELGQDQAILRQDLKNLRQELGETYQRVSNLERRQDSVERTQRQIKISHSHISNLTINTHPQVQALDRKVQEVQQTQRQNQTKPLQDPSTSGFENADNARIKSDSQNSKPGVRIKAESSELKSSKSDKEQYK